MRQMLCIAMAVGIVMNMGTRASAAPPVVVDEAVYDDTLVIPAGVGFCDFDVQRRDTGSYIVKVFFNKDGNVVRVTYHERGTTYYALPGDDVVAIDRFSEYQVIRVDPETDMVVSNSLLGNKWNVHAGSGGVLVNESGRIVFDGDGTPIITNGPKEAFRGEFGDLCAALVP